MILCTIIKSRIEKLVQAQILLATRIQGGYTPAERWRISLSNGDSVFAKIGTTSDTANWLRNEYHSYQALQKSFMPKLVGWSDDAQQPILLLEDLSQFRWPPPWQDSDIDAVLETLNQLHQLRLPLRPFAEVNDDIGLGWQDVANDPKPFLNLNLVSESWLNNALPVLLENEANADTLGDSPTHWDIRSDNICLTDRGAVLIDWNFLSLGNPKIDIGFWLPSLQAEGGPQPEAILPDSPDIAAFVSGFYAARAGLPIIPQAPRVREIQLTQLKPALSWTIRALKLPEPF